MDLMGLIVRVGWVNVAIENLICAGSFPALSRLPACLFPRARNNHGDFTNG